MANIIDTLHPKSNPSDNLYPNIKAKNIPSGSIDMLKLSQSVQNAITSASPKVFDTSANILALTADDGVAVATDTGYVYVWDSDNSAYVNTGISYVGDLSDVNEIKSTLVDLGENGYSLVDVTLNNGYVQGNTGLIKASTLSRWAVLSLSAGESIKVGTAESNIALVSITTTDTLNIGDTVTPVYYTQTSNWEEYTYTAETDVTVVVSFKFSNYLLRKKSTLIQNSINTNINQKAILDVIKYPIYLNTGLSSDGSIYYREGYFVTDWIPTPGDFNYVWNYASLPRIDKVNVLVVYDSNKVKTNYYNVNTGYTSRQLYNQYSGYVRFVGSINSLLSGDDLSIADTTGLVLWNYDKCVKNISKPTFIKPQTIGHGYGGPYLENTIAHYDWWTKTKGANFIECDLILTSDNVYICRHYNISGLYTMYDSNDNQVSINISQTTYATLSQYTWTPSTHPLYPSLKILSYMDMLNYVRRKNLFLWVDCNELNYSSIRNLYTYAQTLGILHKIFIEQYTLYWYPDANIIYENITSTSDIDDAYKYKRESNDIIVCIPSATSNDDAKPLINYAHSLGLYVEKMGGCNDATTLIDLMDTGYDFVFSDSLSNEDI